MGAPSDAMVRALPTKSIVPLVTFPDQDEFVFRHEQGTLIEMRNERAEIKRLNEERRPFQAWPVAPIPGLSTAFSKSWLFLVKTPSSNSNVSFPSMTERFKIDMASKNKRPEGTFTLVNLPSTRIQNPYESHESVKDVTVRGCAAFKVDVPRSWQDDDGVNVELDLMANFQTAQSLADAADIRVDREKKQIITITWDMSSVTFEAELAALRRLTEEHRLEELAPSQRSLRAFETIRKFDRLGRVSYQNLHDEFPQLANPFDDSHRISEVLLAKLRAFDADHKAALDALSRLSNGVHFVNGCPGAGKTEWNMVLAALLQSKKSPKSKRRHGRILFLVDINKTVDDAANRYQALCKEAGLDLRVIRMHGWPFEMKNSAKLNKDSTKDKAAGEAELDFAKKFLTMASLARHCMLERNPNRAPTLDQASWEFYELNKHESFKGLTKVLRRMEDGEALGTDEWRALRSQVSALYSAVLAKADFVATTPVAAYGGFARHFEPDVIFFDEASHARELTTLIPIAFFSPMAWIFTGDVKQSRPFVKSADKQQAEEGFNPFSEQLRLSTMARAAAANAIDSQLLVNKRAYGDLHRLPSKMFYKGMMRSAHAEAARYPPSVRHLKGYLEKLGGGASIDENRVVVRLKESAEATYRSSFWNPAHHGWVLGQVQRLLQDEAFDSIPAGTRGRIMIATPYRSAARQYQADVRRWRKEWQDRVEVLTVDQAQGNQADVVFLDMVRTTRAGFMDDAQRLNVAITRARQAEVIVMHQRMTIKYVQGGMTARTQYLSQIWDDAAAEKCVVTL